MSDLREELLRPSLKEEDDVQGFDRPWDPMLVLLVGLMGGPEALGILMALNARRLGLGRQAWACLGLGFLASLLAIYLSLAFVPSPHSPESSPDIEVIEEDGSRQELEATRTHEGLIGLARAFGEREPWKQLLPRLLGLGLLAWLYPRHRRRFRLAQMGGVPDARFWPWSLAGLTLFPFTRFLPFLILLPIRPDL